MRAKRVNRTCLFIVILLCSLIMAGCGRTEPEYMIEYFRVTKIESEYVYVSPEYISDDTKSDSYVIERKYFRGFNFQEGSKIEVYFQSLEKGDLNGIEGIHSVNVMAE
ncbi:MAG: hypothetical protein K5988_10365 [Lachnospiraceae bacterium]|nr:hypothetical protein [Lachnospiraceae bacterium]